ncbi:MAG: thioredoxin 1 [Candidatus Nanohaloarchaea archaeon]|jgi:thioredoxin 1
MVQELTADELDEVFESDETWIIDFWADWCQPCKVLAPRVEEASEEFEDINFGKLDMEEYQSAGGKYGVRALPTLLMVKNGEEVARASGAMQKDKLFNWIQNNS